MFGIYLWEFAHTDSGVEHIEIMKWPTNLDDVRPLGVFHFAFYVWHC